MDLFFSVLTNLPLLSTFRKPLFTSHWSQLPMNLFLSVLTNLPVVDVIRCAAVCTTWSGVVNEFRSGHLNLRCRPSPWLLFSRGDEGDLSFYSVLEKKVYTIRNKDRPTRDALRFVTSSHGWLFTVDRCCELYMFNPITGAHIDLPSIIDHVKTIVYQQGHMHPQINTVLRRLGDLCLKGILSSDPLQGDYMVVILHKPLSGCSFVKAGDKKWTTLESLPKYQEAIFPIEDAIFHNGQLYTVTMNSQLVVWDASQLQPKAKQIISTPFRSLYGQLVENPGGDLLLIERATVCGLLTLSGLFDHLKIPILVYKLDTETCCLVQIHSYEECAIFLGTYSAFCLPVDESSFQSKSRSVIYFTNDYLTNDYWASISGSGRKTIVARVDGWKYGKCSRIWHDYKASKYSITPIWIAPTLPQVV